MSDHTIAVFICPACSFVMSEFKMIDAGDGWTSMQCWKCGHQLGARADRGELDLGIIPAADETRNQITLRHEVFEGIPSPQDGGSGS